MANAGNGLNGTKKGSMRARYLMIGGFLGAGKSTAVGRLARRLTDRGLKVGLITNDQGRGLVDTATLRHQGFSVEEIAGGCFCCRFDSLRDAARKLTEAERPDVFVAEPVGSCTDLLATVSYPLRRLYGDRFDVAPLSVMVDPLRCARVLGIETGRRFSPKVAYVYQKQLEEAQVLVINKIDRLEDAARSKLRGELERRYPEAVIFEVSARHGAGLEPWFEHLEQHSLGHRPAMDIDYEIYGEGEARLGWLNATLRLEAREEVDGNVWTEGFARALQGRLEDSGAEVAHLKMTLAPSSGPGDLALINLVDQDLVPELSERLRAPVLGGQLVVNLRAEAEPELLASTLADEIAVRSELSLEHVEHFAPAQPEPTHRLRTA